LEGDGQRYLRFEYTLSLKTHVFRPSDGSVGYIDTVSTPTAFFPAGYGVDTEHENLDQAVVPAAGLNAFKFYVPDVKIPTLWGKTGANATVSRGAKSPSGATPHNSLKIHVQDGTDQVDLVNSLIPPDDDTLAILSTKFKYVADAAVELGLHQKDPTVTPAVWVPAATVPLGIAAKWKKVHEFHLLSEIFYSLLVQGTGVAADAHVADLDIRHITSLANVEAPNLVDTGPATRYEWSSLTARPYLLVLHLASGTTANVTISDDLSSPDVVKVISVDPTKRIGIVELVQPKSTSLSMLVPDNLVVALTRVQVYDWYYDGVA
jgi:hypothetical protein